MAATAQSAIAVIGIDIGKNSTSLGSMVVAQSCCGRSGRVVTLCQYVPVPDRHGGPASVRIISVASSRRWGTMCG